MLFLPDISTVFYHNTWLCNCVIVICDMTLNLNPRSKNWKQIENKSKNKKENKIKLSLTSIILTYSLLCTECMWNKSNTSKPVGLLHSLTVPDSCFNSIQYWLYWPSANRQRVWYANDNNESTRLSRYLISLMPDNKHNLETNMPILEQLILWEWASPKSYNQSQ